MASPIHFRKFTAVLFLAFLIILCVFREAESRGRGGSRFSRSSRSSFTRSISRVARITPRIRYPTTRFIRTNPVRIPTSRVRLGSRVRVGSRIRVGSRVRVGSGIDSSSWRGSLLLGHYYGSRAYMRRRRYFRNQVPTLCRDYYTKDASNTVYGTFICPMEFQSEDFDHCCGLSGMQSCCDSFGNYPISTSTSSNYNNTFTGNYTTIGYPAGFSTTYHPRSGGKSGNLFGHTTYHPSFGGNSGYIYSHPEKEKLSGGQIAGIVIGVIILAVLLALLVYCCCLRNRGTQQGTVLSRMKSNMMQNKDQKQFGFQPAPLSDPEPLPADKYLAQPQDTVHPTVGNAGVDNMAYGMGQGNIPPGNAPYGMNPPPPPAYDNAMSGYQPYPQAGGLAYPPPGEQTYSSPYSTGQAPYPPAPQ